MAAILAENSAKSQSHH